MPNAHPLASSAPRTRLAASTTPSPSAVPVLSQILLAGFDLSARIRRTMKRLSHHTDGDNTANFPNTLGEISPCHSDTSPPSDEPPSPVSLASGNVRYVASTNGLSSSTNIRPYSSAFPPARLAASRVGVYSSMRYAPALYTPTMIG